jgi:hypothetical protein
MIGAIQSLPQYAFVVWCSVKAQGQLYLYHIYISCLEICGCSSVNLYACIDMSTVSIDYDDISYWRIDRSILLGCSTVISSPVMQHICSTTIITNHTMEQNPEQVLPLIYFTKISLKFPSPSWSSNRPLCVGSTTIITSHSMGRNPVQVLPFIYFTKIYHNTTVPSLSRSP